METANAQVRLNLRSGETASAQSRQSVRCSYTQIASADQGSYQTLEN